MILLDQIVQVFRCSQLGVLPYLVFARHLAPCAMRCGIAIQSDADGSTPVGAERFAEERLGRRNVSLWTQPEVDCIALLVHCTVEIDPSAAHLQVRLVYAPGAANFACIASPALFELRDIPMDPTHDRRMCKLQSTSFHHLDKIP